MGLANTLAVCQATGRRVLLGDPRQLHHPIQGIHPPDVDVSALGHLLGESAPVDPSHGVFLDHTRRMHPDICAFTTEQFYEGRLRLKPELHRPRRYAGRARRAAFVLPACSTGMKCSAEEAECVVEMVLPDVVVA